MEQPSERSREPWIAARKAWHLCPSRDLPESVFASIVFGMLLLVVAVAALELGVTRCSVWLYAAAIACLVAPFVGVVARDLAHPPVSMPATLEGATLVCYGKEKELHRVLNCVPLPEPVVFARGPYGVSRTCFYILLVLGMPVLRAVGLPGASSFAVVGMMLLFFLNVQIPPEHFRIMPGRLQVLRCGLFSKRLQVRQEIRLAGTQITCRFDKRKLLIRDSLESYIVNLRETRQPHAFVEAVFSAARFPHAPAEPSGSELLG